MPRVNSREKGKTKRTTLSLSKGSFRILLHRPIKKTLKLLLLKALHLMVVCLVKRSTLESCHLSMRIIIAIKASNLSLNS